VQTRACRRSNVEAFPKNSEHEEHQSRGHELKDIAGEERIDAEPEPAPVVEPFPVLQERCAAQVKEGQKEAKREKDEERVNPEQRR
jgi:hypothetical protein